MNLRSQLLCVSFSISCWEARKQDKKITKEVADAHNTDTGVGRYHKDLLPDAPEHEAILKIRNAWRVWHYENTLPWGDDGMRVIRSSAFMDYAEKFREYKEQFDTACNNFFLAYPKLQAQAQLRLNTLYNPADYPDVSEVKRRFAVRMNTYPLPNSEDFRIIEGIPPEEIEQMCKNAVEGINAQVADSMRNLWERMYKVVSAMHTRLSVAPGEKGGKFHDTLVSNVQDMIALVPKLNLTNDPEITRISVEMSALTKVSPDTLRSSVEVRAATAAKAAAIAKSMAAYIGA